MTPLLHPNMTTAEYAEAAQAAVRDRSVRDAAIGLWARRDHLTEVELGAIRTALAEDAR